MSAPAWAQEDDDVSSYMSRKVNGMRITPAEMDVVRNILVAAASADARRDYAARTKHEAELRAAIAELRATPQPDASERGGE